MTFSNKGDFSSPRAEFCLPTWPNIMTHNFIGKWKISKFPASLECVKALAPPGMSAENQDWGWKHWVISLTQAPGYLLHFLQLAILFFFFWLCWVFLATRGLSLVAASGGLLFVEVHRLLTAVACCGARALGAWALEGRLSSCGSWALERRLSSCGART